MRLVRVLGTLVIVAGALFLASGIGTWAFTQSQLSSEKITVHEDSERFAGEPVDGPFTAWAQAAVVKGHVTEATKGKSYAELPQEDPTREMAEKASFVRASLMTSVLAFSLSALVAGLGVVLVLVGVGIRQAGAQVPVTA